MNEYTIDINGKRYELNEAFRDNIERQARGAYGDNDFVDCWWTVAKKDDYGSGHGLWADTWEECIHDEGDPVLVIETYGKLVPASRLDQLEADMTESDDEPEELDAGNGMKTIEPPEQTDVFGRTHFHVTPKGFEEVPQPDGEDPQKVPPEPERIDDVKMIQWIPSDPEVEHDWGVGEAVAPMESWVEWNVQKYADQPRTSKGKVNSHDSMESLCKLFDCEVVAEHTPSDEVPKGDSGSVKRKGKHRFEDGIAGGGNWNV